jgi:hypothetical protein
MVSINLSVFFHDMLAYFPALRPLHNARVQFSVLDLFFSMSWRHELQQVIRAASPPLHLGRGAEVVVDDG